MEDRIIGVIGAFDEHGLYGLGPHIPWGTPEGRSYLKKDMTRFVEKSRKTAPEGKKNTLIVGRGTAEAMGMMALPGRRMIILSQTLDERMLNGGKEDDKWLYVARNAQQAVEKACSFPDGGHVFFGGGYDVWLQGLSSSLCNAAFITVVKSDTSKQTRWSGEPRYAPEMLLDATFSKQGMNLVNRESVSDIWLEHPVELEFRDYLTL